MNSTYWSHIRARRVSFIFAVLSFVFVSCGGTGGGAGPGPNNPPSPPSPPPTSSLYRGDWGWAAVNLSNANDYIGGIASFSTEVTNNSSSSTQYGKKVAGGLYDVIGVTSKPAGVALMGAIATPLDMGFFVGENVLMVAVDSNGAMETGSSGKATFSGLGRVYATDGSYVSVAVALVQSGSTPTYLGAKTQPNTMFAELTQLAIGGRARVSSLTSSAALAHSEQLANHAPAESGTGSLNDLLR
jgi:hypothetical protein